MIRVVETGWMSGRERGNISEVNFLLTSLNNLRRILLPGFILLLINRLVVQVRLDVLRMS